MSIPTDEGLWVRIPGDWAAELGLDAQAEMVRTAEGVLVKKREPARTLPATWDEIFANKLSIGQRTAEGAEAEIELTGDDYYL